MPTSCSAASTASAFSAAACGSIAPRAEAAIRARIGDRLGLDAVAAARGIATIADGAMSLAVRAVSVNRGIDPRDATVIAFGGAGPLHAAAIAREIAIPRVVVPKLPGNFSALGMLMAAVAAGFRAHADRRTRRGAAGRCAQRAFADLRAAGEAGARARPPRRRAIRFRRRSALSRPGAHDCRSRSPAAGDLGGDAQAARQRFHVQHDRRYGHAAPDQSIEIVNLRLVVTVPRMEDLIGRWLAEPWCPMARAPEERRPVVFDDPARPVEARDPVAAAARGRHRDRRAPP